MIPLGFVLFGYTLLEVVLAAVAAGSVTALVVSVLILNWDKIKSFFNKKLGILEKDKNVIAASIKQNLDNGNYKVVNCLYDKSTEKVVDEAEIIDAKKLDNQTHKNFGDKDLLIQ